LSAWHFGVTKETAGVWHRLNRSQCVFDIERSVYYRFGGLGAE
jgi:hypothetical protein